MNSPLFDVMVLGGGIIGRSTAFKLKKAKPELQILLIDQFLMSQSYGSSKGRSKGIQKANWVKETKTMKQMRIDSLEEWKSLQHNISSKTIMKRNEALFVGPADGFFMRNTLRSLRDYPGNQEIGYISNDALRGQYPHINFSDTCVGLLDKSQLCLAADDILKYILEEFRKLGGTTGTGQVVQVTPGDIMKISTKENVYRTKKIVIATGPWSVPMMQICGIDISLTLRHVMEGYWKLKQSDIACPSLFEYQNKSIVWTNYTTEYGPCLKIVFSGKNISHENLNNVKSLHDEEIVNSMSNYFKDKFGKLISDELPFLMENCIYTFTKDKKAIIGRHPKRDNIFLAVGMSGTGFGYSPAISDIVCDLVLGKQPKYDISEFSVTRF